MQIRRATIADIHGAHAVQQSVRLPSDHQYRYAENLMCSETANFVAVKGDNIVGFISILIDEPDQNGPDLWRRLRPYVAFVGVVPELQLQKVGTQLIRVGANATIKHTRPHLWAECREGTGGFFEKLGFVRVAPAVIQQTLGLVPKGPVYILDHSGAAGVWVASCE